MDTLLTFCLTSGLLIITVTVAVCCYVVCNATLMALNHLQDFLNERLPLGAPRAVRPLHPAASDVKRPLRAKGSSPQTETVQPAMPESAQPVMPEPAKTLELPAQACERCKAPLQSDPILVTVVDGRPTGTFLCSACAHPVKLAV